VLIEGSGPEPCEIQLQALKRQVSLLQEQASQLVQVQARLAEDLWKAMRDPLFNLPGGTTLEQQQNLIEAIMRLNHGQKQLLYRALGGRK
jgi:hypothetical protein